MISTQDLVFAFERNLGTIKQQLEGLSHDDCLLQPPFNSNCMNWVLGHIADTRNTVLKLLGQEPVLTDEQAKRYGYGSEPVCADGPGVLPLAELVDVLERSQVGIAAGLSAATPEDLAKEMESFMGTVTLDQFLFTMFWHDSYHTGQTDILRQLAGTNDKII